MPETERERSGNDHPITEDEIAALPIGTRKLWKLVQAGWTINALARAVGIHKDTLRDLLYGRSKYPHEKTREGICRYFKGIGYEDWPRPADRGIGPRRLEDAKAERPGG